MAKQQYYYLNKKRVSKLAYDKATFKPFLKANGLDAVIYENLTTYQKKVYNGVKTAANRLTAPNGRFVESNILKRDIITKGAKFKGLTPLEYWTKYKKLITDTFSDGLPLSKNSFNMAEYVEKHNGKFFYKGKPISKKQLLYKVAQKEQGKKTKATKKDDEESDSDFLLIYELRHNILTNEVEVIEISSLKDRRE